MFLLILENIGTQELVLIGLVALIFLGPRRMPELARKIGKVLADLRSTTNEFKETWQREVNFEEERKAFDLSNIDVEATSQVGPADESTNESKGKAETAEPAIREVDPANFNAPLPSHNETTEKPAETEQNDKRNWL